MSCGGVLNNDPVLGKGEELVSESRVVFQFQPDRSAHEIEVCWASWWDGHMSLVAFGNHFAGHG